MVEEKIVPLWRRLPRRRTPRNDKSAAPVVINIEPDNMPAYTDNARLKTVNKLCRAVQLDRHGLPSAGSSGLQTLQALKPLERASPIDSNRTRFSGFVRRPGGQSGRQ